MGTDYFSDQKRVDTGFKCSDCKINTFKTLYNNKKCIQNVRKLLIATLIDITQFRRHFELLARAISGAIEINPPH